MEKHEEWKKKAESMHTLLFGTYACIRTGQLASDSSFAITNVFPSVDDLLPQYSDIFELNRIANESANFGK